jgi:phage gp36-like protein
MAYTNKSYFLTKINMDELNKLTGVSDDNLDSAIQSADSMINSYLKNVVTTVPITSNVETDKYPPAIRQCSYDLAIFYLHDRIQYSEIPQWVKEKYNAAIDFLTKIAKGIITLEIETENPSSEDYQKPDNNVQFFGSDTVMERGSF